MIGWWFSDEAFVKIQDVYYFYCTWFWTILRLLILDKIEFVASESTRPVGVRPISVPSKAKRDADLVILSTELWCSCLAESIMSDVKARPWGRRLSSTGMSSSRHFRSRMYMSRASCRSWFDWCSFICFCRLFPAFATSRSCLIFFSL